MPQPQTLAEFLRTDELKETNLVDRESLSIVDFCRGVLDSREYRQSILNRITLGTLPPAVELRLYDYAHGKPPDRVEHTGKDGEPIVTEVRRVIVRMPASASEEVQPSAVVH